MNNKHDTKSAQTSLYCNIWNSFPRRTAILIIASAAAKSEPKRPLKCREGSRPAYNCFNRLVQDLSARESIISLISFLNTYFSGTVQVT